MNTLERIAMRIVADATPKKPYCFIMTCLNKHLEGKAGIIETSLDGSSVSGESLAECVLNACWSIGVKLDKSSISVDNGKIAISTDDGVYEWKVFMKVYDSSDISRDFIVEELKKDGISASIASL